MANPTLKADQREITGRKVKSLRREGILPANVYGKKLKSRPVQTPLVEFKKVFEEVGETGLVDLKVSAKGGGDTLSVLIHNIQVDPVTDEPLHADFLQVDLKEKVTATVPLEFMGESPAEKAGEGIVIHQMNEVEVEALPMDLPDRITVDVSGLSEVDDAVYVKDLSVDRVKVEVKEDPERIVANVAPPAVEEVVEAPPQEVEVPEEGEGEPTEGKQPKEGGEEPQEKKES